MQTVSINGKDWAAGFLWQAPEGSKSLTKMARLRARQMNAEYERNYNAIVVRSRGQVQFGFGESEIHPVPALPSLAVALAQAKGGTWLGQFVLAEGVYVVGVMDGTILAEGDMLCSPEEAQERISDLDQLISMGEDDDGWDERILCETPEESEEYLQKVLHTVRGVPKVKPVNIHVPVKKIAVFSLIAITGLVSHGLYSSHLEKKEAERLLAQQQTAMQEAQRLAEMAERRARENIARPWQKAPMPAPMIAECRDAYSKQGMFSQGWELTEWRCDYGRATTVWTRKKEGSFKDLPPRARLNLNNPKTAHAPIAIDKPVGRGQQGLITREAVARMLFEFARRQQINVAIKWEDTPADARGKEIEMPYKKAEWKLTMIPLYPDQTFESMLDEIPGFVVRTIYHAENLWTLEGELYAKK